MAPDRTILHLVKHNYGVHTIKPHLRHLRHQRPETSYGSGRRRHTHQKISTSFYQNNDFSKELPTDSEPRLDHRNLRN